MIPAINRRRVSAGRLCWVSTPSGMNTKLPTSSTRSQDQCTSGQQVLSRLRLARISSTKSAGTTCAGGRNTDRQLTHRAEKPKPVNPRTKPANSTTRLLSSRLRALAFSGMGNGFSRFMVEFIVVWAARPPEFV